MPNQSNTVGTHSLVAEKSLESKKCGIVAPPPPPQRIRGAPDQMTVSQHSKSTVRGSSPPFLYV
jgi:hypothetical protein